MLLFVIPKMYLMYHCPIIHNECNNKTNFRNILYISTAGKSPLNTK